MFLLPSLLVASSFVASILAGPAVSDKHKPDYAARNLATVQRIYNLTVFPNNVPIIEHGASAVPSGLFALNATGRVTPIGNFSTFNDSIEYFFALAPTPQSNFGLGFYKADVVEFTSGCPNIAASVVYLHAGQVDNTTGGLIDPNSPVTTLKEIAFWRFDNDGLVTQYDAWIPTLETWTITSTGLNFSDPAVQTSFTASLCPTIQERCTGTNQQYADVPTCVAELELKPFGDFDETWGDNIVCRFIHLFLTIVRPEVHCPHVGPFGGNGPDNFKCVNIDFHDPSYYTDDDILFSGEMFTC